MAWGGNPLFRHPGADGEVRWTGRGLRRAHHRRLLRQQPGPCRGHAARARRAQGPRPAGRGGDRRGARSPRRAPRGGGRRRSAAPAGTDVNAKAKQRAWSHAPEADQAEPDDVTVDAARSPPLVAPEGLQVFDVGDENAGERLDRFLGQAAAARRVALSRTRLKSLIEAGEVRIDEKVARDPSTRLAAGARIVFEAPVPEDSPLLGEDIKLAVVYEDDHLIVIDKPAGLVVHPAPGHAAGTLVNALIRHCGASLSGVGGVKRPGIVHRLDKDTSGLLVVAKTDAAHQGLADLLADHGRTGSLEREYLALVWGGFDIHAGKVEGAIGRDSRHREKMAVVREER